MKYDPGERRDFWRSAIQIFLLIVFMATIYSIYAGIIG